MYGILMTAALAGATSVPGNGRAWEEIYGVYGGYGSYGGFGGFGCGYSGYSCYARYSGCGPGPGYVYFIDNGCCNRPYPIFVPAPPPPPCFSPFCMPPMVDFMIGQEMNDRKDMKHDMRDDMTPDKKKKRKRRKGEDDEEDDARLVPGYDVTPLSHAHFDPRFNHRVALTQAMWRRVRL